MSHRNTTRQSFHGFLSELMAGEPVELPPWELSRRELIELMSHEGRTVPISKEMWWEYLELLPPRWMNGYAFIFAEGGDRFHLFWEQGDKHFVRQLSEQETELFCKLSGARRWQ